jgi:hypothetical protein
VAAIGLAAGTGKTGPVSPPLFGSCPRGGSVLPLVLLSVACISGVCVFHVWMCCLLDGCILVGSHLGCFICPVVGVGVDCCM